MKRLIILVLAIMVATSLTACGSKARQEPVKVKCPACGYEFEAPPYGR